MTAPDLLTELNESRVVRRPLEDLVPLLEAAEVLAEHGTPVAGRLRILVLDDQVVFQEEHPERRELLLRRMESRAAAEAFVRDRLDTYDRMWDGCGCKVDYDG